jgi:hypothetical protein
VQALIGFQELCVSVPRKAQISLVAEAIGRGNTAITGRWLSET